MQIQGFVAKKFPQQKYRQKKKERKEVQIRNHKTCIVFAYNFFHENFVEPISTNVESAYTPN